MSKALTGRWEWIWRNVAKRGVWGFESSQTSDQHTRLGTNLQMLLTQWVLVQGEASPWLSGLRGIKIGSNSVSPSGKIRSLCWQSSICLEERFSCPGYPDQRPDSTYEGLKLRLSFAAVVRAMENTFGDNFAKEIDHQKRLFYPSDRALS